MSISDQDHDTEVAPIAEFVDGYASMATRTAYRSDLSLWAAHCRRQGDDLFEVRRADIEGYARHLEAEGLAPATVNRRLATITGFYRWAPDEGLVTANAAGNVPPSPTTLRVASRRPVAHRAEGLAGRGGSRGRPPVRAGVPARHQRPACRRSLRRGRDRSG